MIKYFIRQYGRYIAMALAFATITFLINSCEVNAETLISSALLNYSNQSNLKEQTIYNGSGMWTNQGRGYLTFNIVIYNRHTNTSIMTPILKQVVANSNGNSYTCNIGSTSLSYSDSYEDFEGNVYTVVCDMVMGSTGLSYIKTMVEPQPTNTYWLVSSQLATFDTNLEIDIANRVTAGVSILNGKMDNILSAINQTRIDLANTINADASQILQAIQNQGTQAHADAQAQKESTDNINNSINNGDTSSVSLDTITGQTQDVGAISGLLTIPLSLLSGVITAFNGTCLPYNIGYLFGTNLIFPCIDLESILGSFLWDTIDILISGIFIFYISKKFINLFNKLINLENIRLGVVDFV